MVPSRPHHSDSTEPKTLTRRRTLQALGAGGVLALAGRAGARQPRGIVETGPTVATDSVVLGTRRGVAALSRTDGTLQWHRTLGGSPLFPPTVVGDTLATALGDSGLSVFDADTEQWSFDPTATGVVAVATGESGPLVAATDDHQVHAFDPETGRERWSSPALASVDALVVTADTAYAGTEDGWVRAYDTDSGDERWSRVQDPAVLSLTVGDGTVFAGDAAGKVTAYAAADGAERWRREALQRAQTEPGDRAFVGHVSDGAVVVTTGTGTTHAMAVGDGAERWRFEAEYFCHVPPTVVGGRTYVVDEETLYAVEAGERVWRQPLSDPNGPPAVADGTVFVAADGGPVRAFDAVDGTERWAVDPSESVTPTPTPAPSTAKQSVSVGDEERQQSTTTAADGPGFGVYSAVASLLSVVAALSARD